MISRDDVPPAPPDTETLKDPATTPLSGGTPLEEAHPLFFSGEVLAGRFRIVRFLARGGMGEVYEAEDLDLRERVAVKTIRPEAAHRRFAPDRFRREIQLARRVTHRNVCRIYDLFRHVPSSPSSAVGEVQFLSMEFLSGGTLSETLRRRGRFEPPEALPIVRQMAEGLAAAHAAGVIHRDFKSANVMLVPTAEGPRAVITDFGLARAVEAAGSESMTTTGLFVGTPAYMAPEQVRGEEVTSAADVYALGVVLYEMIAGTCPFLGSTPLSTATKRLSEPPPSLRELVPGLDPRWERTIVRCLAIDPQDRFAGARDVVRALEGEKVASRRDAAVRRRRIGWVAAGVIAAAAAAGLFALRGRLGRSPAPVSGRLAPGAVSSPRRTVAVLGFQSLSRRPADAWLSTALSEMLTTELAAGETLRTIPGEDVARAKTDLSLGEADALARKTLARVHTLLGADFVVLGSYLALGDGPGTRIRLDLRLQDTAAGETVAAVSETGTQNELFDLVSRAGGELRGKLGAGGLSPSAAGTIRAARPTSAEAARLYAEGLASLRLSDAPSARSRLEAAVAADPAWPLAHAALAETWTRLGYDIRAREEARRAFDLSAGLSREDRLSVEGRYRETTREWEKAIDVWHTLFGFFPDDLEYGLRLAGAQTQAGKGQDALATVAALRRLPPPGGDDTRIDLAEAAAAMALSDYRRQLSAADAAAEKARRRGASLQLAKASQLSAWALSSLGRSDRAVEAENRARTLFHNAGARVDEANAIANIGYLLFLAGDRNLGRSRMEEALAAYREMGTRRGEAVALHNLTILLFDEGQYGEARRQAEQTLEIEREIGDRRSMGLMLNILGLIHVQLGDIAAGKRMIEESTAIMRELHISGEISRGLINSSTVLRREGDLAASSRAGDESLAEWKKSSSDKGLLAYIQFDRGALLAARGDLEGARRSDEEAIATCRQMGNKSYLAHALSGLGALLASQGNLAEARKDLTEGRRLRRETGERGYETESSVLLAALDVEEGNLAAAESAARAAAAEFAAQGREGSNISELGTEAGARLVLARALLAEGKLAEARAQLGTADRLVKKSPSRFVEISVAITRGRADSLADASGAARNLAAVADRARRSGFVELALEAELARGEAEIRASRGEEGRARLRSLAEEARRRGFGLVARRAAAAAAL